VAVRLEPAPVARHTRAVIRIGPRPLGTLLSCLILAGAPAGLPAQGPAAPAPGAEAPAGDPLETEMMRARILARLGLVEEALAAYRALLERHPDDRPLREEYAELLVDAGLLDQAAVTLDRYLADDPTSVRLRRLRARVDVARGAGSGRRPDSLGPEAPTDPALAADLAAAELAAGRWRSALDLYGRLLESDPENRALLDAHREIVLAHAPRVELGHYSLLQTSAEQHVEEAAWRAWVAERWWVRAGARYGTYHQERTADQGPFTEYVGTVFATLGFQATRALSFWGGIEESRRREDIFRTTGRLGAAYDDARATTATLDAAIGELLTNPVSAVPKNGSTDRVSVDVARRILTAVVLGLHYDYRHYRASDEELGNRWEAAARTEIELVRSRVQVTLIPQVFFAEYTPTAGSPLREEVSFIRREQILGIGGLFGWDVTSTLRLQAGAVGRRDVYRAITSWEVTGEGRWRIRPWLEGRVLYTRNTESTTIGGLEQSFLGRLEILY